MEYLFLIIIISFITCLFIASAYFKAKDFLIKKDKCMVYMKICVSILTTCIILMSILEFM